MFCYNLCSWFIKNIVFSLLAREIISPIMLSSQTNFYPLISLFFVLNLKVYNVDFLYLVLTKSRQLRWSQIKMNAKADAWEVAVDRVLLQEVIGRGAFGAVWRALLSSPNGQPGNRTVAAKCFTRKHLQFVLLIHMLISGVVIKMFHLGRGGKAWSKITYRPTHTPIFFTQGYAREKKKVGKEQTNKEDNQLVWS